MISEIDRIMLNVARMNDRNHIVARCTVRVTGYRIHGSAELDRMERRAMDDFCNRVEDALATVAPKPSVWRAIKRWFNH